MARLSLPSPRRTVRRGVRLCQRMGYTEREALVLIDRVAQNAAYQINLLGEYDTEWVNDIHREARNQLLALRQQSV